MRILTAEQMQAVDRTAIEELGVPGMVLMENAAIGVVEALVEAFPEAESAAIFCGPGNNGGDGLAIARHLAVRGFEVEIFLVFSGRSPSADAANQLTICEKMDLAIAPLDLAEDLDEALDAAGHADLIIDALFGLGLTRPLAGDLALLVSELNGLPVPKVAVDIPSGLHASRAAIFGPHVHADLTVTFAAPKIAHIFPPAADAVGELAIADLGVPGELVEEVEAEGEEEESAGLYLLEGDILALVLPGRSADSHKGDYGHAVIVAGSPGKSGAAILAARAAVRGGAGLVTVAVPESLLPTVELGSVESMSLALPAGPGGEIAAAAVDRVLAFLAGKKAVAVGPGLGSAAETAATIRRLALEIPLPLVLDADGVNAFAGRAAELAARGAAERETILTPHSGELARLLGTTVDEVEADRVAAVRRAAKETGAVVVLKGHLTLIATPEGEVHVNPTGNPALATGGTGDVLTGWTVALLAQGLPTFAAAALAVHLHGLAGDLMVERLGGRGLTAGDLIDAIPLAYRSLAAGGDPDHDHDHDHGHEDGE